VAVEMFHVACVPKIKFGFFPCCCLRKKQNFPITIHHTNHPHASVFTSIDGVLLALW